MNGIGRLRLSACEIVPAMLTNNPGRPAGRRMMSAKTLAAYRNTCYQVGAVKFAIGRRSQAMDALLSTYRVREAAFVTAFNPFSRLMPAGWNRRMHLRLTQVLRRRCILSGTGSWRSWSETHVLIFGDVRGAYRLMRLFRQNGIVIIRRGQPARLMLAS
jgi:Protein of unknown function (DUF3293)